MPFAQIKFRIYEGLYKYNIEKQRENKKKIKKNSESIFKKRGDDITSTQDLRHLIIMIILFLKYYICIKSRLSQFFSNISEKYIFNLSLNN